MRDISNFMKQLKESKKTQKSFEKDLLNYLKKQKIKYTVNENTITIGNK